MNSQSFDPRENSFFKATADIKFWIIFFFALRMYGITNSPLEVGHNIRQSDGLMIARNFYEGSHNIFYPTVDVAGEKSGIVGSEFPILNYLIYLLATVFGFENWFGRLINLIVSSIGVYCFYRLIKNFFTETVAFNSAMVLLASLWFTYSRKNIPDTFAASLCITSVLFAFRFLQTTKWYYLLLYFMLGLLGCLSKISATVLMTILALPCFFGKYSVRSKFILIFFSVIILLCVIGWYFVWVPYLNLTYGYEMFFMGWPISEGVKQLFERWPQALARFYDTPLKYSGFIAFLGGLYFIVKKKHWLALAVFLLPMTAFLIVSLKAGQYFVNNEYYILVIVPVMAFVAGLGIGRLNNKVLTSFILCIICIEGVANKIQDFRIRQPYAAMNDLERIMDQISKPDDLIAINSNESGTPMFLSHRRGWRTTNELLMDKNHIDYLKHNNCKYILILRQDPWSDLNLEYQIVYESEFFKIFRIF